MKIRILNRRKPSFVHVFLFLFIILLIMFVIHLKENKPITRGFLQTPGYRIIRTSLLKHEIIYEDINSADTQMEELKDDKTNAIMDNVAESYHGDIMAESEEIIDETEEFDADVRQTGVDFVTEVENDDVMQMNAVTNKTAGDETLMEPQTAKSALNIFIIEEHHEALPYWFEAADNGILPKTDNTLIHIDGHSDMAPPFIIPGFPLFKWPRKDQVRLLMQRNDAFIQSAIMAGLISRVVWVWPQWDHGNHETHHESFMVKIGWTLANTTNSSDPQIFHCACQESYGQQECSYYNFEQEEVQIEPQRCKIRRKFLMEMVNELSAFQVLKEKDWILDNENIILDIDEDFYGCSYVIKPLLDANVTMETVKAIDNSIKEIVCPITTVHETHTNRILLKTVALIRLQKLCHKENLANCSKSGINLKADLILYKLLIDAFDNNETYFCQKPGKQVDLQTFVGEFIKLISELTVQQLMVIEEIGFCSTTTPKALPLYQPVEFGLCYGANTPAISVITEFTPTSDDILRRSLILKLILKNLKKNRPKIVSICRSVRDGYTPRKFFSQIENDILSALNKTFEVTNIHYDLDLLGGKEGRPGGSRKFGAS